MDNLNRLFFLARLSEINFNHKVKQFPTYELDDLVYPIKNLLNLFGKAENTWRKFCSKKTIPNLVTEL